MTISLVRHAQAGSRKSADGDDRARRLTHEGRHQAADIVGSLVEFGAVRVLSSPYRRCIETVAPLAAALGLFVEIDDRLAEGPSGGAVDLVRAIARSTPDVDVVLCSHGDIIPGVLDVVIREDGVDLGADPRCQKGSVWMLEPNPRLPGRFAVARYVPPPRS